MTTLISNNLIKETLQIPLLKHSLKLSMRRLKYEHLKLEILFKTNQYAFESLDETALLALGILVEEAAAEAVAKINAGEGAAIDNARTEQR